MNKKIFYVLAIAGIVLLGGCKQVCTVTGTITDELASTGSRHRIYKCNHRTG